MGQEEYNIIQKLELLSSADHELDNCIYFMVCLANVLKESKENGLHKQSTNISTGCNSKFNPKIAIPFREFCEDFKEKTNRDLCQMTYGWLAKIVEYFTAAVFNFKEVNFRKVYQQFCEVNACLVVIDESPVLNTILYRSVMETFVEEMLRAVSVCKADANEIIMVSNFVMSVISQIGKSSIFAEYILKEITKRLKNFTTYFDAGGKFDRIRMPHLEIVTCYLIIMQHVVEHGVQNKTVSNMNKNVLKEVKNVTQDLRNCLQMILPSASIKVIFDKLLFLL